MKRCVMVLALALALATPSRAQEFPKPTEAGQKGLDALIRRCIDGGGLKETTDPKTGQGDCVHKLFDGNEIKN